LEKREALAKNLVMKVLDGMKLIEAVESTEASEKKERKGVMHVT
jgi:hypothetical protein